MRKHITLVFVLLLLSTVGHGARIPGLYFGHFTGSSNGAWLALVRQDLTGFILAFDATDETSFFETFVVQPDGSLSFFISGSGWVEGTFAGSNTGGTAASGLVTFYGERLEDSGPFLSSAGVYSGSSTGSFSSAVTAILTPSGKLIFYAENDFDFDGGYGQANLDGSYSMQSIFGNSFSGAFQLGASSLSGTFSGGGDSGTYSLQKVEGSPISAIWSNSLQLAENWYSDWIGLFYSEDQLEGWIYHQSLGWIFVITAQNGTSTWTYRPGLGWIWTHAQIFPYGWSPSMGWLFYQTDSENPAWFFRFNTGNWTPID